MNKSKIDWDKRIGIPDENPTPMKPRQEIDFEEIINNAYNNGTTYTLNEIHIHIIKEAMRQAKTIILQEAADKAEVEEFGDFAGSIDKDSILNLEHSEELNKRLGL